MSSSLSTLFISQSLITCVFFFFVPTWTWSLGGRRQKRSSWLGGKRRQWSAGAVAKEALKRRWRRGRLVSVKHSVGFTYSPPSQVNPLRLPLISVLSFSSSSYIFVIGFVFFFQIWEAAVMKQKREAVVWQRVSPVKGGALVMQKPLVVQKQLMVRRWCDRAALWDPVRPRRRLEAWRLGLVFFLVLLLLLFLILV